MDDMSTERRSPAHAKATLEKSLLRVLAGRDVGIAV